MGACFLKGFGLCDSKLSGEHSISAGVLRVIAPENVITLGGYPWQEPRTVQRVGVNSLRARVLCVRHNSALSPLDDEASRLTDALVRISTDIESLPGETIVDGERIERWLLKAVLAAAAARHLSCTAIAETYKGVLTGNPWPSGCGLYAGPSSELEVFTRDVVVDTFVDLRGHLTSASFRIAGVKLWLILRPSVTSRHHGLFHPYGFVFNTSSAVRRIKLHWPAPAHRQAVIYSLLGPITTQAPHTVGWSGESA